MRKPIIIWAIRILAIVFVIYAVKQWGVPLYRQYVVPKKKAVYTPTFKAKMGSLTVSFHEIGTLEAEKSVPVTSEVGGKIITLVAEGRVIPTGALIAQLDTTELERKVRDLELAYENALSDVDRAEAQFEILKESNKTEMAKAKAQADFDQTELERAKKDLEKKQRLAADKLVRQTEVEQAEFTVRSKQLTVDKGREDLALKLKETESKERQEMGDVRNRKFRANMAKFALEEGQRDLNLARIYAPSSGLVVMAKDYTPDGRRKLQEGDSVRPRQVICTLPDLSSMLVKVNLGESDAPKIKLGMGVLIRLEAIPGRIFHGNVSDISSLATEPSPWDRGATPGRKNFEVVIRVKEVDPQTLKPGMTADAEFIMAVLKDTVYVPMECITEREGKTYVYVKNGKRFDRRLVTTGSHNDSMISIKSGLSAGELVALRDPTQTMDQQEAGATTGSGSGKQPPKPAPVPEPVKK